MKALGMALATLAAVGLAPAAQKNPPDVLKAEGLAAYVDKVRAQHHLPALAAAVVRNGAVGACAATGFRKEGDATRVQLADKFHIGSCTKSMTATVAAMLVEEGRLKWDTTIAQVFPELADTMRPESRGVTLLQLLSHHAGMPPETFPPGSSDWRKDPRPLREQRYAYLKLALKDKPESAPGTRFDYANRGYVVVGAMLEKITGKAWEDLLRERLFKPLGMATAGFGWMASPGKVDQPWPHTPVANTSYFIPPGPGADNPLVIGPAGTVHCSIGDLAKYAAFHIRGERGEEKLLKQETFHKLHTPPFDGDYALGWVLLDRDWGGGKVLFHNGSNTMNYAVMWLAPLRDFGVVVATNQGGAEAEKACDEVAGTLVTALAQSHRQ